MRPPVRRYTTRAASVAALAPAPFVAPLVAGGWRPAPHRVERRMVHGGAAVELTRFAIRSTPRRVGGGTPTVFRGRTMVVDVRSAASPTGRVLVRELLQPAAA